jgi:ATP-dependent RNA helicase RhlE
MFKTYALAPEIHAALEKMNFSTPTPVQEQTIPAALDGRDVISLAETGSGKTLAYLAPTLTAVLKNPKSRVLVLAPTRELAVQIGTVIRDLAVCTKKISSIVVIGGASMDQQVRALRNNVPFIVATPGRLMDHIRSRNVDLRSITHLIIDEADRMFDMGFAPQVNEIVRRLSAERQTMLFSATFPKEVRGLAEKILKNPLEIEVRKNERPPIVIEQKMLEVTSDQKNDKTLDLVNAASGSVVIFTRTKNRTDRLAKYLEEYGVKVTRIHGDRSQGQRNKSIQDFKAGLVKVLVATDIAARGLDVPSISDVINYDLPQNPDDYIHRIGRTGRAGNEGQSLTLVTTEDHNNWNYLARKMGLALVGNQQGHKWVSPQRNGGKGSRGHGQRHGKPGGHQRHGHGGKPKSGSSRPSGGHSRPAAPARPVSPRW